MLRLEIKAHFCYWHGDVLTQTTETISVDWDYVREIAKATRVLGRTIQVKDVPPLLDFMRVFRSNTRRLSKMSAVRSPDVNIDIRIGEYNKKEYHWDSWHVPVKYALMRLSYGNSTKLISEEIYAGLDEQNREASVPIEDAVKAILPAALRAFVLMGESIDNGQEYVAVYSDMMDRRADLFVQAWDKCLDASCAKSA